MTYHSSPEVNWIINNCNNYNSLKVKMQAEITLPFMFFKRLFLKGIGNKRMKGYLIPPPELFVCC